MVKKTHLYLNFGINMTQLFRSTSLWRHPISFLLYLILGWALLFASFILFTNLLMNGKAETIYVDDDGGANFTTIQEAVDHAKDGDVIFVHNGSYPGDVTVHTSVSIVGETSENVMIVSARKYGFSIKAEGVRLKNFTISLVNSTGILVESTNASLSNVVVKDCGGNGLISENSSGLTIKDSFLSTLRIKKCDDILVQNLIFSHLFLEEVKSSKFTHLLLNKDEEQIEVYINNSEENVFKNSTLGTVLLFLSQQNRFINNSFSSLLFSEVNEKKHYNNTFDETNTIFGEKLLYLFDKKETVISEEEVFGLVVIAWCENVTLSNFLSVYQGVKIIHSKEVKLENSIFSNIDKEAVYIAYSTFSAVKDSIFLHFYSPLVEERLENITGRRLNFSFTPQETASSYFSPIGVLINSSLSCELKRNIFFLNESDAVVVLFSSQVVLQENNFTKEMNLTGDGNWESCPPSGRGVYTQLSFNITLLNNTFFKYKYALQFMDSQENLVMRNHFISSLFAISSYYSSSSLFKRNAVKESETGYLFVGVFQRELTKGDEEESRNTLKNERITDCKVGIRVRESSLQLENLSVLNLSLHAVESYDSSFVKILNITLPLSLLHVKNGGEIQIFHFLQVSVVNRDGSGVPFCDINVRGVEEDNIFYSTPYFGGGQRRTGENGKVEFIPVLSAVLNQYGFFQKSCSVEVKYSDFSAKDNIWMVGPTIHTIRIEEATPLLIEELEDFFLYEDSEETLSIDLAKYFLDELDSSSELKYNIFRIDSPNSTKLNLEITQGHFLNIRLNPFTGKDWYGYIENIVLSAKDSDERSAYSNPFRIKVVPVNDPPEIEIDEVFLNSGVEVVEDKPLWLEIKIKDVDNKEDELQILLNDSRVRYIKENHTLRLLFPEGSNSTLLNLSVSDGNATTFLELKIHFIPVNDLPSFSFLIEEHQAKDSFLISWMDEDVDSSATISLYYDTDGEGEDGQLIASGINEDDETDSYLWDVSGLAPGYYYLYAVIQDEVHRVVVYHQHKVRVSHADISISLLSLHLEPSEPKRGEDVIFRGKVENNGEIDVVDLRIMLYLNGEMKDQFILSGTLSPGERRNFELYLNALHQLPATVRISCKGAQEEINLTVFEIVGEETNKGAEKDSEKEGALAAWEVSFLILTLAFLSYLKRKIKV